ncbi:MAG: sigma-54 dependent transcriptional regulator, partial [Pseudomonas sp.]
MSSTLEMTCQVLLVDDDPHLRQALSQTLDLAGFKVSTRADAQGLAAQLPTDWPGVVVSDIRMPGLDDLQLLEQLQQADPQLPVILITGHGDVPMAVQAMRAGAFDFLEKPFASDDLLASVRRALALRQLVLENRSLRLALADRQQLSARLLGRSPAMQRMREQLGALAAIDTDVLILGETGAGKEVVARALHDHSSRRNGPFVAINAGALAESVVESELFGHEAGAFTGAQKRRIGKFEFANGGTLFLDEIESMSLEVQVKLLRLLQERVVERLGGNQLIPLDIRIIAASKEDLRSSADQGRFRADLYYRLNVTPLRIPPLRERGDDVLSLFQHFADAASSRHGVPVRELPAPARAQLLRHGWPGNVRELQNAAQRFA